MYGSTVRRCRYAAIPIVVMLAACTNAQPAQVATARDVITPYPPGGTPLVPRVEVDGGVPEMSASTIRRLIIRHISESNETCRALGADSLAGCKLDWRIVTLTMRPEVARLTVRLIENGATIKTASIRLNGLGHAPDGDLLEEVDDMLRVIAVSGTTSAGAGAAISATH